MSIEDTPDWALNDEEAAGETHSPSAPPEGTLSEGCQTDDELAPNWMKPGQQPEEDNEEYVNVDDLEHQPGWMSKQQAPSSEDKSSIGSMREQKYKPGFQHIHVYVSFACVFNIFHNLYSVVSVWRGPHQPARARRVSGERGIQSAERTVRGMLEYVQENVLFVPNHVGATARDYQFHFFVFGGD